MDTPLSVLTQCRLFQGLSPETLEREVLPWGRLRDYERQAVLVAPGDRVDWFAVVLRGKTQILQIFSDGTTSLMDLLGAGYTVGTDLICPRSRRAAPNPPVSSGVAAGAGGAVRGDAGGPLAESADHPL